MIKEAQMSLIEKLGYLGSFINALAMIGSVIYLALQVRQANQIGRASCRERVCYAV